MLESCVTYADFAQLAQRVPRRSRIPIIHPVYRDLKIGHTQSGLFVPKFSESWYAASLMRNAISNYDGIISARAAGQGNDLWYFKNTSITPTTTATWYSLFKSTGVPAAIAPSGVTGGSVMNNASTGAMQLANAPSGNRYLLTAGISVPSATGFAVVMLVDLLWAAGAVSVASSPVTVTGSAVTRFTNSSTPNAVGNQMCICINAAIGAVAINPVMTYTNQGNTGSRTASAATTAASAVAQRVFPADTAAITLQSGDTGVVSIQSFTLSTTTGTIDLYIYRPLMLIPTIAANTYVERDSTIQIDGIQQMMFGSDSQIGCYGFLALAGGTSACATQSGFVRTVYG